MESPSPLQSLIHIRRVFKILSSSKQNVSQPQARLLLDEAVEFISQPANERPYFILELAEYFLMLNDDDEPKGKLPVKVAAFCADH